MAEKKTQRPKSVKEPAEIRKAPKGSRQDKVTPAIAPATEAAAGAVPRRKKATPEWVKRKADRAEARARGEDPDGSEEAQEKAAPRKRKSAKSASAPAPAAEAEKPKRGRPTLYDPSYIETVLELGAMGKSDCQIAAHIGVNRRTLSRWADEYPAFREALGDAHDLCQSWWENMGQTGMLLGAKGFNSATFIFQMKNRFRKDYREKIDVGLSADTAFVKMLKHMNGEKERAGA